MDTQIIQLMHDHDVGIGLLWAQVTHCVKVANDTFKVMKQHNYDGYESGSYVRTFN